MLRKKYKITQKAASLWSKRAEFARTLRATFSTLEAFAKTKETAGGNNVASQKN